jgi:ankyrin repeat protein
LYYAASFGLTKRIKLLINQGAGTDAPGGRNGGTALHAAVLRQIVPVIKILLDPERPDFNGTSPVFSAISWGNKEIIQMLVDYGASVDPDDIAIFEREFEGKPEGEASMQALLLRSWAISKKS